MCHVSNVINHFALFIFLGICYGFQALDKVESPNTAFTIFRTRFPKGKKIDCILFYFSVILGFLIVVPYCL